MKTARLYVLMLAIVISCALACKSSQSSVQTEVNAGNENANLTGAQPGGVSGAAAARGKTFRGSIGDNKVQVTLMREGDQLTGTYSYLKNGGEISLKGSIDGKGDFALKEFDNSGAQTGQFKGKWSDPANLPGATLEGEWSKPNSKQTLVFYATEQLVEFSNGLRVINKPIKEEDKKQKYTIDVEYPELTGASNPNADKFNQEVKSMITKQVSDFKKDMQEQGDLDLPPEMDNGSSLNMGYDITLATNDLISVIFNGSTYEAGAAHPNSYSQVLNYDLKAGKTLKLEDLFKPGADYIQAISSYAIADLKKQAGADGYDSEWLENGAGPKDENYQSWNISKKGLAVTFDAYQVASYAEGPKNVIIPYSTLKDVIKPDGALASVANSK